MELIFGLLIAVSAFVGCGAAFVAAIDDGPPFFARLFSLALSVVAFALCGLLASCI